MLPHRIRSVVGVVVLALAGSTHGQQPFNYAEALQKSQFFYEAQQSGVLSASNRVSWRGDSALEDGSDVGHDLTGGWYDGGDHVKFGFPMAFAATALAWGAIDFREGYVASGQLQALKKNLRFVNDYFIKAHTAPNELWGQVGDPTPDHAFWGSAEVLMMNRPAFKIDSTHPGSELAAETAAAMAAASIVFASDDPEYSATLLRHAIQLYDFADNFRGNYSESISQAKGFYTSFTGFNDELVWGAIWLYRATGEVAYLNKAEANYDNLSREFGSTDRAFKWTTNWDEKTYGCYVLLAKLTGKAAYKLDAERNLDYWTDGVNGARVKYTPGGLAYLDHFDPMVYAANASFLALYYQQIATTPAKALKYYNFARQQMNYMLGANPAQRSFVVGFGVNPPRNIHHRTAHGTWTNLVNGAPALSRHILYGALMGGPDPDDRYFEDRGDFFHSDVTTNGNALFSGALAKLVIDFGGTPLANFPVRETPADEFLIEAKSNPAGMLGSDFSIWVNNHTAWPARIPDQFKFRVFLDITEGLAAGFSAGDYVVSSANNDVTFTNLLRWAPGSNIYYVEVAFSPNTVIWPGGVTASRKEAQVRISLPLTAPASAWNAANDWSSLGLTGTLKAVNFIPLYADGLLVAGVEPPRDHLTPVTGVTVAPASLTLAAGATATLTATVLPTSASNPAINWVSLNPSIATVSPSGTVTALVPGTTSLRATTVDGGFTATAMVTVPAGVDFVPLTGVTLSPQVAAVPVGGIIYMTAGVVPANASIRALTWSSNNPSVAMVNSAGEVFGVAKGSATITVTSGDGVFSASALVAIGPIHLGCSSPTSIRLNFAKDGVGEFCYIVTGTINFVNSWNMELLEINGVRFSNRWSNSLPPKIEGRYVIHYVGPFPWSHFEINGTP